MEPCGTPQEMGGEKDTLSNVTDAGQSWRQEGKTLKGLSLNTNNMFKMVREHGMIDYTEGR